MGHKIDALCSTIILKELYNILIVQIGIISINLYNSNSMYLIYLAFIICHKYIKEIRMIIDVKAVMIGQSGVGKSTLLSRIRDRYVNKNIGTTVGLDFISKTFEKND